MVTVAGLDLNLAWGLYLVRGSGRSIGRRKSHRYRSALRDCTLPMSSSAVGRERSHAEGLRYSWCRPSDPGQTRTASFVAKRSGSQHASVWHGEKDPWGWKASYPPLSPGLGICPPSPIEAAVKFTPSAILLTSEGRNILSGCMAASLGSIGNLTTDDVGSALVAGTGPFGGAARFSLMPEGRILARRNWTKSLCIASAHWSAAMASRWIGSMYCRDGQDWACNPHRSDHETQAHSCQGPTLCATTTCRSNGPVAGDAKAEVSWRRVLIGCESLCGRRISQKINTHLNWRPSSSGSLPVSKCLRGQSRKICNASRRMIISPLTLPKKTTILM